MKLSFREQDLFSRDRAALFGGDEGYFRFQDFLLDNPRFGDVVPGTGGARKIRWADPSRGRGKKGGIRVYYYYSEEYATILFLFAFDKNIDDLTQKQKQLVTAIVREFNAQLKAEFTPSRR